MICYCGNQEQTVKGHVKVFLYAETLQWWLKWGSHNMCLVLISLCQLWMPFETLTPQMLCSTLADGTVLIIKSEVTEATCTLDSLGVWAAFHNSFAFELWSTYWRETFLYLLEFVSVSCNITNTCFCSMFALEKC